MAARLDRPTRQMITGNLMLVGCCIFYLLWWLIAFNPESAITGIASGWLLIPAVILGVLSIIWILMGAWNLSGRKTLYSNLAIAIGGLVFYIIMLFGTLLLLNRQVTEELFLIIGWLVLVFIELNALYSYGHYSKTATIILLVIMCIATVVSLVCYILYYDLDPVTGYVDGIIPLALLGFMMIVISVTAVIRKKGAGANQY
ncbi:MAG: hypothetical protein LUB61_05370 [Eggerthellaceae bacterium]|nr:hypothetical protein [Eggerthellaceae bacterium]